MLQSTSFHKVCGQCAHFVPERVLYCYGDPVICPSHCRLIAAHESVRLNVNHDSPKALTCAFYIEEVPF